MSGRSAGYEVQGGVLAVEERPLLDLFSLALPLGTLTALVGHGGAGKSSLLRCLGGRGEGLETRGIWTFRGGPLRRAARWGFSQGERLEQELIEGDAPLFLEQVQRATPLPKQEDGWQPLLDALSVTEAPVWLLDEPTAGAPEPVKQRMASLLLREKGKRTIVLVTHDQELVRGTADQVCILGGGRIELHEATTLFHTPTTRLGAAYQKTGTSWVCEPPTMPELPTHFHWILPGQMAGMGRPGLNRDIEEDLTALSAANVQILVSLTEEPFPVTQLQSFGIEGRHFPIRDMGFPTIAPTARLCRSLEARLKEGDRIAFHCHAGLGRTGMMLGAMLVWMRRPASEAIAQVRAVNPRFIQTREQERFLERFQEDVG
jgi:atypical dual specificity phosphatase